MSATIASSKDGIEVRGMRELRKSLKAAGDDLQDLKDAHKAAATLAAGGAKTVAPIASGRLASSIRPAGTKAAAIVRAGSKKVPYAHAIQWGRKMWPSMTPASGREPHYSYIKPRLYLTSGAKATEPQWVALYEAALSKALDQVKGA